MISGLSPTRCCGRCRNPFFVNEACECSCHAPVIPVAEFADLAGESLLTSLAYDRLRATENTHDGRRTA